MKNFKSKLFAVVFTVVVTATSCYAVFSTDKLVVTYSLLFGKEKQVNSLADLTAAQSDVSVSGVELAAPITLTANLELVKPIFQHPGAIITTNGKTLTIDRDRPHGEYQRFIAAVGEVIYAVGATDKITPSAAGFSSSGTVTANAAAIHVMLAANVNCKAIFMIPSGVYAINPITQTVSCTVTCPSFRAARLDYSGTGTAWTFSNVTNVTMSNLEFQITDDAGKGVRCGSGTSRTFLHRLWIQGNGDTVTSASYGIASYPGSDGSHYINIRNCKILNNYYGIYVAAGVQKTNELVIEANMFSGNYYPISDNNKNTGWKIHNNAIENFKRIGIWSNGLAHSIKSNRFELNEEGLEWSTFVATANDISTCNPMRFGDESEKMTVTDNEMYPYDFDKLVKFDGIRYMFIDAQKGLHTKSVSIAATSDTPISLTAATSQTTNMFEGRLNDGTPVWSLSKANVPYDRRVPISSSAGALVLDCDTGRYFKVTLSENITSVLLSNGIDGMELTLEIVQASSGGPYTYPTKASWTDGTNGLFFIGGALPSPPDASKRSVYKYLNSNGRWIETSRAENIS